MEYFRMVKNFQGFKDVSIKLDSKKFKVKENNNKKNGIDFNTLYYFRQERNIIFANYIGGNILKGELIGILEENLIDSSFMHVTKNNEFISGTGIIKIEKFIENFKEKKVLLKYDWNLISTEDAGFSIFEEINN